MKKNALSLTMMVLSLAACGGNNGTDGLGSQTMGSTVTLAASTTAAVESSQFLMDAYRDGLLEIRLGQLALQQASSNDVKRFAHRMIDDHTRVNNNITQLAQRKGITLPTDLSAEQTALVTRLSALSGEQFDREYMAANVTGHQTDVAAAIQQALNGNDTDVRMLAATTLPLLKTHLAVAEEINGLLDPTAFLVTAYQDGLFEVQLSQLALQKATNADVKQFAQRMIDDHTQVNNRIATLAQQKGVTLPSAPSPDEQAELDDIGRFSGPDFDKAYMDKNVILHVKDVRQASQQAENGRDTDVKNFGQQTLPALGGHLVTAIDIDNRLTPSFLYMASQDGIAELALAQLAVAQASNDQVKAFAQRMLTDHMAANAQIMQLAQQRNVPLPVELSAEQLRAFIDLLGRSGADFDREYMAVNVRIHQRDVGALTEQSQAATDAGIKSFAANTLPVLTSHLTSAVQLAQQVGAL